MKDLIKVLSLMLRYFQCVRIWIFDFYNNLIIISTIRFYNKCSDYNCLKTIEFLTNHEMAINQYREMT